MFELTGYMEDEKFAMLRCECGKVKTILLSDFDSHTDKYCILKDGQELICPYCGRKHTEKVICKESQTFSHINLPTCPTCGSHNVAKISTGKKLVGFAAVGVFSSNFNKTMECKNCHYKW